MSARQTRAIALLAGHGAVLLFAFGYYADLTQSLQSPPVLPPVIGLFFVIPAIVPAIGVGVSYSALAASTTDNDKSWKVLETLAVSLFALMMLSAGAALYLSFTTFNPFIGR